MTHKNDWFGKLNRQLDFTNMGKFVHILSIIYFTLLQMRVGELQYLYYRTTASLATVPDRLFLFGAMLLPKTGGEDDQGGGGVLPHPSCRTTIPTTVPPLYHTRRITVPPPTVPVCLLRPRRGRDGDWRS